MLRLYQFPGGDGLSSLSPPCVKVEMALRQLGEEHEVVLFKSTMEARRASPSGRVPVLEVDGEKMVDSVLILDELERRNPEAGLFPRDPRERVIDRLWEHFANDHMYWLGFTRRWVIPETRELFFTAVFGRMPFPARLYVRGLAMPSIASRAQGQGTGLKSAERVDADIVRAFEMVETGLGDGPFLQGRNEPGRGDLAVASIAAQLGFRDTMPTLQEEFLGRPGLVEHVRGVYDAVGMPRPRWLQ